MKVRFLLAATGLFLSATVVDAGDFALVADGKPTCVLLKTGNRTVDADIAFFADGIRRMTGAGPKVRRSRSEVEVDGGDNVILFEVEERPITEEDEYEIDFPDAKTMRVVGTETSCRWALNRLLEEQDVVFCSAGPHGTHWPVKRDIAVSRVRRTNPASMLRLERDLYVEDPVWLRSNGGKKQKGRFFWHNLGDLFPVGKYGKEPWLSKIMPEKNGKRTRPSDRFVAWEPCFASQEGVEEAIRNICDHLDRHPDQKTYSLAVNDEEGYCECEDCRKLNGGSFEKSVYLPVCRSFSQVYYTWVNRVAKGVAQRYPHVVLGLLAYLGLIDPPPFKLEPNVVPYVCFDIQQLSDPKARANRTALLRAWSEKAGHVGIWDYSFCCPYAVCFREYPTEQADFFALKKEACPALDGFFTEGQGTYLASEWRRRYLYLRLAFDTTRDPAAELDRWYRACVGEAAADDLKAYYGVWEDFCRSTALKSTQWYKSGATLTYFSIHDKDYLFALDEATRRRADGLMASVLAKAEASGTDDQKVRARKLMNMHEYFATRQVECGCGLATPEGKMTAETTERYLAALPAMRAAERKVPELTERVFADARETKSPPVEERLRFFRKLIVNENRPLLMNGALAYVDAERLCTAMGLRLSEREQGNAGDLSAWRFLKRGLDVAPAESVNGTPRLELTANAVRWKAAMGCVTNVTAGGMYCVSARITNAAAHPIKAEVGVNSAIAPSFRSQDRGQFASATLAPGESKTLAVFSTLYHRSTEAKIVLVANGLKEGEHVFADSISLRRVDSERQDIR